MEFLALQMQGGNVGGDQDQKQGHRNETCYQRHDLTRIAGADESAVPTWHPLPTRPYAAT
ncbi:hypothetical protein GCM10022223_03110 [Kineosporia mesophila]|uniref:Uncharacterized protein n=1 Tax=Kineosporia mesophila TaxID=566012 RepID=A0ABP6YX40_9ACTN